MVYTSQPFPTDSPFPRTPPRGWQGWVTSLLTMPSPHRPPGPQTPWLQACQWEPKISHLIAIPPEMQSTTTEVIFSIFNRNKMNTVGSICIWITSCSRPAHTCVSKTAYKNGPSQDRDKVSSGIDFSFQPGSINDWRFKSSTFWRVIYLLIYLPTYPST